MNILYLAGAAILIAYLASVFVHALPSPDCATCPKCNVLEKQIARCNNILNICTAAFRHSCDNVKSRCEKKVNDLKKCQTSCEERKSCTSSSPAISNGTSSLPQNNDSDSNVTPNSAGYDIGADESGSAPPSPPPTVTKKAYPLHTNIVATTFWVGEIFDPDIPDGSQVCSTYDSQWAFHWSGVNTGTAGNGTSCEGSPTGGCDGIPGASKCETEVRTSANGFFPTSPDVHPQENPFYLDLPFDDINDPIAFAERAIVIPWANDPGYSGQARNQSFSYMKNRWVKLMKSGRTCYGQVQDAGPSHDDLYHDSAYVFGSDDGRPVQTQFNNAGMDVSPALNGCLGFAELNGVDRVDWQFVDDADVPDGPWKKIVTTRQVFN